MWEEGFHLCLVMTQQLSTVMDCIITEMVTSFMEMIPIPTLDRVVKMRPRISAIYIFKTHAINHLKLILTVT